MTKELEKFCENYEVKIVNDTGRYARYRPPVFFSEPERADIVRSDIIEHMTEKLYTLQIPESRLRTLMEMERRFFNNNPHEKGYSDMFEMLMSKEREEAHFRNTNEAVKKAYEQYSIMLNLAGYQRKI
jgi:hypothetical protein